MTTSRGLSCDELNRSPDEIRRIIDERGIGQLPRDQLDGLPQPVIYTTTKGRTYSFDEHWTFCRAKFSDESIEKVNILYNTLCRQLVLDNIRSKDGLTLAEELRRKINRTPEEVLNANRLKSRDIRARRGPELNAIRNQQNALRREQQSDNQSTIMQLVEDIPTLPSSENTENLPALQDLVACNPSVDPSDQMADDGVPDEGTGDDVVDDFDDGNIPTEYFDQLDFDDGYRDDIDPMHAMASNQNDSSTIMSPNEHSEEPSQPDLDGIILNPPTRRVRRPRTSRRNVVVDYSNYLDSNSEPSDTEYSLRDRNSSQNDFPICEGHVYDPFGVLKLHSVPVRCNTSIINKVDTRVRDSVVETSTFDEIFQRLDRAQLVFSRDNDLLHEEDLHSRQACVKQSPFMQQVFHLHLGDAIKDWDTLAKTVSNVASFMSSGALLRRYKFHFASKSDGISNLNCISLSFSCANAQRFTRNEGTLHYRTSRCRAPLECHGQLDIRVYLRERLVAFRHRHRHHCADGNVLGIDEINLKESVLQTVEEYMESKLIFRMSKTNMVQTIRDQVPGSSKGYVERVYDRAFRSRYINQNSDWLSCIEFVKSHSDVYAPFVFYTEKKMGLAIIFKEVISLLDGIIDSVSFDSTHKISRHKCELFVPVATVDRTGIPVGYMFVKSKDKVIKEIKAARNRGRRNPIDFDAAAALPSQCSIAKSINCVAQTAFPNFEQTALITCFLLLLFGTNKRLFISPIGCHHDFRGQGPWTMCSMALDAENRELVQHDTYEYDEVTRKRFNGIDIPLFTTDKDESQLHAMNFTNPQKDVKLCFWHMLRSVKLSIVKMKRQCSLHKFLTETVFPPIFATLCPALFDRTPHVPEQCPYMHQGGALNESFKCIQCFSDEYKHWTEPRIDLSKRGNAVNRETTQQDSPQTNADQCTYRKLRTLLEEHSRAIWMVPQIFLYLPLIQRDISGNAVYYTIEQLSGLIVCDMLAFCLKYRVLELFEYLWKRWYREKWLRKWTQCHSVVYNPFTTNMISEGDNSLLKNEVLGPKRTSVRLDHFMFVDRNTRLKKHNAKLGVLIRDRTRGSHFESEDEIELSWVKKRWSKFTKFSKYTTGKENISSETYLRDCVKFGTDAEMFTCGCHSYKKNNVHLCPHIARAISPQSFAGSNRRLVKINLRARRTTPFYLPIGSQLENATPHNEWSGLALRPEYIEFWSSRGRDIIAEKGGRQPAPISTLLSPPNAAIGTDISRARRRRRPVEIMQPERDIPTDSDSGSISLFTRCGTCLDCIPASFLRAGIFKSIDSDLGKFSEVARVILETEIKRISLADSTVLSRTGTDSLRTAILTFPDEIREGFLRKAVETRIFAGGIPSKWMPATSIERINRYIILRERSTV